MNQSKRDAILRSAQLERLDSIITEEQERLVFSYDDNGYPASMVVSFKVNFSPWKPPVYREDYTYSSDGFLEVHSASWFSNINLEWELLFKEEYVYYENGNLAESIYHEWNGIDDALADGIRRTFYYLDDNRLDYILNYRWDESQHTWRIYAKYEHIYDSLDRLKEITRSFYYSNTDVWEYVNNEAFLYNSDDLLSENILSYWNKTDEIWISTKRVLYNYYKGQVFEEIHYTKAVWQSNWQTTIKYEYFHFYLLNYFEINEYYWDEDLDYFELGTSTQITYDKDVLNSDIMLPPFFEYGHLKNKITYVSREYRFGSDLFYDWIYFYYSPKTTATTTVANIEVKLYPNPASDHLVIEIPEDIPTANIRFINLQGNQVLEKEINGGTNILFIPHLPLGIIMAQIHSNQLGVVSIPILIQR